MSFRGSVSIIEINNEPVVNSIALEKEIAQNLTCNRLHGNVEIQWFKVIELKFSYGLSPWIFLN